MKVNEQEKEKEKEEEKEISTEPNTVNVKNKVFLFQKL